MKSFKIVTVCLIILYLPTRLVAQESSPVKKNDSITLAQAYINLSLTEKYFETLSTKRISKIIPFEEDELASIIDTSFINKNAKLYNFAYSLLYVNKIKLLHTQADDVTRKDLLLWKNTLDKAIFHFESADQDSFYEYTNDAFYELINFNKDSRDTLHHSIFELKRKSGPYFNNDIYPDFKRLFNIAKTNKEYHIDSLSYFANIYDLEINTSILNHEYNADNYNYGPKTLVLRSEYRYIEKNYLYHTYYPLKNELYFLDPKLDLISRYLQLEFMASKDYEQTLSWFQLYKLHNEFNIYSENLHYYIFSEDFKAQNDPFFQNELNIEASKSLFQRLIKKFPYDSFILAQSFINLSIMDSNFSNISSENISVILNKVNNDLINVQDSNFISEFSGLYDFTYSLLYFNVAKLRFRDKREINRNELVQWKNGLEKAIESFNNSQEIDITNINLEQDAFYRLIKFSDDSQILLRSGILTLKEEFTPYFNTDIYTEFKKIFYVAKNTGNYEFNSLLSFASIYNLDLELSILDNRDNDNEQFRYPFIKLEYELDEKLDLISRYLQLKYLASDNVEKLPEGLSLDSLYSEYFDLKRNVTNYKDVFFEIELNPDVMDILYQELQVKYPHLVSLVLVDSDANALTDQVDMLDNSVFAVDPPYYFFPNPAPKPSAYLKVANYLPNLTKLGDIDNHMSRILNNAGYGKQLHYYYHELDGFALATSLEKFNVDGSKLDDDERWITNLGGEGKFSYYEIFKSLFFDIESEFRMFAFIVARKAVDIDDDNPLPPDYAEELIRNSYDTLPEDLKNKTLENKNLTVLVYHFHQNDIGEVPELDLSGDISAMDHLKLAGLEKLINDD